MALFKHRSGGIGTGLCTLCRTFALDLCFIYLFRTLTAIPDFLAVALSFLFAISINFLASYHWVFRGTKRKQTEGYLIFVGIAIVGLVFVMIGTFFFHLTLGIDLYLSRALVASIVGGFNFFINTYYNFRMHN